MLLRGSDYLWHHHVPIARRAGLTDVEIEAVRAEIAALTASATCPTPPGGGTWGPPQQDNGGPTRWRPVRRDEE